MTLLTDEIRALIGREVTYTAPEELGRAAIRYFALAVGDHNPLYTDRDHARQHGLRDVMAPPTLLCETNQYTGLSPDDEGFAGHTWGIKIPQTRMVRGGNSYEWHAPVYPDTVVTATWQFTDASERTTSSGKAMLVLTSTARFTDASGQPLVTNTETIIYVALEQS